MLITEAAAKELLTPNQVTTNTPLSNQKQSEQSKYAVMN